MARIIPVRRCIVENKAYPKDKLIRIVVTSGRAVIDKDGKMPGRGFYVLKCKETIMKAKAKKVLEKRLKAKLGEDFYDILAEEVSHE